MNNYGLNISENSMIIIAGVVLAYSIGISLFGIYFAKFSHNINDFFYSGQRFSWWIPAVSMVATGIGSYSYMKYSEQGFNTGMSSTMPYMNDWFIVPFFMFGWLPIIYFSKVKSIPEYFERRFNRTARYIAVLIILSYLLFYTGYNLYTIGIALEGMFGLPDIYSVPAITLLLGMYVTFGGQTAVMFTDLVQGFMLYAAGAIAIIAGLYALGGLDQFWSYLPLSHRLPFVHLTDNPEFNTSGLFWGEAIAGSIAFTFMNQGFLMRYLTIKSVHEGRKASLVNVLISMPTSAAIIGGAGWIGKAIVEKQAMTSAGSLAGYDSLIVANSFHTFVVVCWQIVKHNPWVFGFIVAALSAALMSTVVALINACAAIGIYDIYKPLIKNEADDKHYLKAARWASALATVIGLALVFWFRIQKGTLMAIHYKGIMVIIPSIVTTIFLGAFWSRFNAAAACASMALGSLLTVASIWFPQMIDPVAAFVFGPVGADYIYMRALFGMLVTGIVGALVTYMTQRPPKEKVMGLTVDTLDFAMTQYKGGVPNLEKGQNASGLQLKLDESVPEGHISLSDTMMKQMKAHYGDLLYICDSRWYLGGLRSNHVRATASHFHRGSADSTDQDKSIVRLSSATLHEAYLLPQRLVSVQKIM